MRDGFWVRFCKMPRGLHFLRGLFSICVFRLMRWLCQVHEPNRCWYWSSVIASGDADDDENDGDDDDDDDGDASEDDDEMMMILLMMTMMMMMMMMKMRMMVR